MQGEHPLPEGVIEQFSKTNGELCKDVFLLSGINAIPSPHYVVSDMLLQVSQQW